MTQIINLSTQDNLNGGDLFPLWAINNGDTRKISLNALTQYIGDYVINNIYNNIINNGGNIPYILIGANKVGFSSQPPTINQWNKGDILISTNPVQNVGYTTIGWICTQSGIPGTWVGIFTI